MSRIGIFIDTFQESIPVSLRKKISDYVKDLPEIAFCIEEENLTSADALKRMATRLETGGIEGVVLIGGSPKRYETSFQKFGYPFPFNPYLLAVANIREQVLWTMPDEQAALEKAKSSFPKQFSVS